jgi:hypothetical protein
VIEIITVFSARRYGSRSHRTKRVLNEQNAKSDNRAEPDIITKSMRPDDVSDEAVCDLLATMEDAQWRAMSLYAKLLRARDASGS